MLHVLLLFISFWWWYELRHSALNKPESFRNLQKNGFHKLLFIYAKHFCSGTKNKIAPTIQPQIVIPSSRCCIYSCSFTGSHSYTSIVYPYGVAIDQYSHTLTLILFIAGLYLYCWWVNITVYTFVRICVNIQIISFEFTIRTPLLPFYIL